MIPLDYWFYTYYHNPPYDWSDWLDLYDWLYSKENLLYNGFYKVEDNVNNKTD